MTEFLIAVLKEDGWVAALAAGLYLAVLAGMTSVIRQLWKQNQSLHHRIAEIQEQRLRDAVSLYERIGEHTSVVSTAIERLWHRR